MAYRKKLARYVNLEDVRVNYDPRTGLIQLTSKDPDLPEGGFRMVAKNGTPTEKALRELLHSYGVLPEPHISGRGLGAVKKLGFTGKGGSGKTTMVALLANVLTLQGKNVLVVDGDLRDGQFQWLVPSGTPTVLDAFVASQKDNYNPLDFLTGEVYTGWRALLPPKDPNKADYITEEFMSELIAEYEKHFDVILIDLPVTTAPHELPYGIADVLHVALPTVPAVKRAVESIAAYMEENVNVAVLLNQAVEKYTDTIKDALPREIWYGSFPILPASERYGWESLLAPGSRAMTIMESIVPSLLD